MNRRSLLQFAGARPRLLVGTRQLKTAQALLSNEATTQALR
jgi:hypothetical protein